MLLLHGSGPGTTGWGAWRAVAESARRAAPRHRARPGGLRRHALPRRTRPDAVRSRRAVWVEQAARRDGRARRAALRGGRPLDGRRRRARAGGGAARCGSTRVVAVASMGASMPLQAALDAPVGGQADDRATARAPCSALLYHDPAPRDRRGRPRADGRDARRRGRLRAALPAAARALGARPRARAPTTLRRRRRPGAAGARRARPAHAARVRRAPPARAAAGTRGSTRSRAAATCPRSSTSRSSSVSSPTSWSPMPELAVLRSPAEVLFGSGMAAAAGGVAARHGRRVLVVTDPVIAATEGLCRRRRARCARPGSTSSSSPTPPSTCQWRRSTLPPRPAATARPDVLVAVGGGSAIDLAKVTALLLAHGGPLSTYYGEHLVPGPGGAARRAADDGGNRLGGHAGLGHRRSRARHEGRDLEPVPDSAHGHLRPGADARRCPPSVTAHSGIDALSHAIEAFMAVSRPRLAAAARARGGRQERALRRARAGGRPRDRRLTSSAPSGRGRHGGARGDALRLA